MKLLKIKINNFRQFYGSQEIEFATDKNKNVTLIHGENNGGKTALLNALRWCLYEKTTDNLLDSKNLMNKHAVANKESFFSVEIQLIHNNKIYEVKRIKSNTAGSKSVLKLYEIVDGCYSEKAESHPMTLINTFLPEEMSEYFFYQGEGTGTLSSQNDFSHIKAAIHKVLGLTIAEQTIKHLNTIRLGYQKELSQFDTTDELSKVIKEKESLTITIEQNKIQLEQKHIELNEAHKKYEEQLKKLVKFDKTDIEEKIKLRAEKAKMLSDLQRNHDSAVLEKAKKTTSFIKSAFSKSLANVDLSQINIDELNQTNRYSVDKQLIQEILVRNECLCGLHLEKGSHASLLIEELSKFAVDPYLKRRWQKALDLQTELKKNCSPKHQMSDILSKIDDYQDRILDISKQIQELSYEIKDSDITDIKQIEVEKDLAHSKYQQLEREIPILEGKIKRTSCELDECERRIFRLSSCMPMAERINKLISATDQIIQLYSEAIATSQKDVDTILLKKMQDFFNRVAFNGYTVQKEMNNDTKRNSNLGHFTWTIIDRSGKKVAVGNGYQAMLSISFIIALIEFSKDRSNNKSHLLTPGTIAPFIADSILAFIGPDNGRELVRYISESVEQSIFMFSQAQWTETHTDKGIRDKIGKEYNLVQHTVLSEDEFKGQYPTQLSVQGEKFPVVRFGSEFDKVTIEEISING
ncbi:AAA family ATPase [Photobacterium damselae]|uniref:DNA repair protein n=1 Tax=Photobacterium damselae TaxID=38293 RepID=A0ABD6X2X3_PHODM|nr:AAA family ATPase [Photobacterium damselae]PSU16716.1 DNA repair protein [Photobacterium damselae]